MLARLLRDLFGIPATEVKTAASRAFGLVLVTPDFVLLAGAASSSGFDVCSTGFRDARHRAGVCQLKRRSAPHCPGWNFRPDAISSNCLGERSKPRDNMDFSEKMG